MREKKVKRMIHACPACGEKEHGKGTGLVADVGMKTVENADKTATTSVTLLRCSSCNWVGTKAECVATEKVEDQQ
jgi:predicted RNA-binding Zn-ribbon protein involved in translation (DUF1610 family)